MRERQHLALLGRLLALLVGLALVGAVVVASSGSGEPRGVVAFPRPGTLTALPEGQLAFRGVGADALEQLVVSGAESGVHGGEVIAHADGEGASFVPHEPFAPGERVRIGAPFSVRGGGDEYEITMARPPPPEPEDDADDPDDDGDDEDEEPVEPQSFVTRPELRPPFLDVEVDRTAPDDDPLVFSIGRFARVPTGIYLMDDTGEAVWVEHTDSAIQTPHVAELSGEPVLLWWEGTAHGGWGEGTWRTVGRDYEPRAELAPVGMAADFHELVLTERGGAETAVFLSYVPVEWDLSAVGGPARARVLETVLQEVEIESGAVVFEWHSLDHVDVAESTVPTDEHTVDHFHGNSVDVDHDGDLLVSARNTSAAYRIDRADGDVRWRLGGRSSDFRLDDPVGPFDFQHDVRRLDDGTLSVFDNGDADGRDVSRVLVLDLDEGRRTARTVATFEHEPPIFGQYTGNARWADDGSVFVSWGSSGAFSEYGPDGQLVLDGTIRGETVYRMLRVPWVGRPGTDPDLALRVDGEATRYFVSWNGATEVDRWRLRTDHGEPVEAPRTGFESTGRIGVGCDDGPVTAVALDDSGQELGTSDPVAVPGC